MTPPSAPFIEQSGTLDTDQIRTEAVPLAGLIGLFVGLALVPFLGVFLFGGTTGLGFVFALATQFVLAVGTGVVLIYVVARGVQLADQ
ncbi:hypothetical protein [Halosimplex halophilum]|uniref:hypothetical protein n=1 Tax=Halosimplex halophilum TaxID=2559572 RepID=UPI00107F94B9|nr:hypothetical protein [Halosimplex halophilum]